MILAGGVFGCVVACLCNFGCWVYVCGLFELVQTVAWLAGCFRLVMLSLLVVWGGDCGLVCFGLSGGGFGCEFGAVLRCRLFGFIV